MKVFYAIALCYAMTVTMSCAVQDDGRDDEVVIDDERPDDVTISARSKCGNGTCQAGETCSSCPQDCGACPSCGDGTCNGSESCSTCSQDCGACPTCGDGTCNGGESCWDCEADCGQCGTCNNTCEWDTDVNWCFCPRDCGNVLCP